MAVVKKSISFGEYDLIKLDKVCRKCCISTDLPLSTKIRCLITYIFWEKHCSIDDEIDIEDLFYDV